MNTSGSKDSLGHVAELHRALASPVMRRLFANATSVQLDSFGDPVPADCNNMTSRLDNFLRGKNAELAEQVAEQLAEHFADDYSELCDEAHALVSSLGFCRLYGITLPSDVELILGRTLPPEVLVAAMDASVRMLHRATLDARELPERFDAAEPPEDFFLCTGLLHLLMGVWAGFIVIDDEYQQHICARQSLNSPLGIWMRRLLDASRSLDDELQQDEQIRLLSVATELSLLDDWRKMLVEPYRDPLPWWLDGTLEAAAKETREFIERWEF